jgi:signal transduction histidine kinase
MSAPVRAPLPEPLRELHDASPDAVMVLEPLRRAPGGAEGASARDLRCVYLNPAAERLLGLSDAAARGRKLAEVLPEAGGQGAGGQGAGGPEAGPRAAFLEVARTGVPARHEAAYPVPGRQRWLRATAVRVDGRLHVTFADVTAERRAEEALEVLAAASGALSGTLSVEAALQALVGLVVPRLADFCAVDVREKGQVRARAAAHRDAARREPLGLLQRMLAFGRAGELDAPAVLERGRPLLLEDARAAAGPDSAPAALLEEVGARALLLAPLTARGESVGLLVLGSTPGGRPLEAADVRVAEELARRAAAALENARLLELSRLERTRAEEANRTKDEFLAVVSHELRQPLNAMLGWLRLYRSGTLSADQRERALETVERNVHAQAQLVEDLLDVSGIITGKLRLKLRRVQLEGVVAAALDAVRAAAHAKGVQLVASLDEGLPPAAADAGRLQQVLWNLLSNAIKFTPRGGQVTVRLARIDETLELVVSDTGAGIPRAFLPHVFERFRQAEPSATRTHKGLGLGLAIVKYLVEQHGGTVAVDSEGEGKGASFTVRLPRAPEGASLAPEPLALLRGGEGALGVRGLAGVTVLVAEASPEAGDGVVLTLEGHGARVLRAGPGADALAALARTHPDVLVVDRALADAGEGEGGPSLLARVRALPAADGGGVPALALLAEGAEGGTPSGAGGTPSGAGGTPSGAGGTAEARARAFRAGFQAALAAPVEPAELLAAVALLVARRPAR